MNGENTPNVKIDSSIYIKIEAPELNSFNFNLPTRGFKVADELETYCVLRANREPFKKN